MFDDTLVSIVDHFLVPESLVEHPDNDQAILVTGRQLVVYLIPSHNLNGSYGR